MINKKIKLFLLSGLLSFVNIAFAQIAPQPGVIAPGGGLDQPPIEFEVQNFQAKSSINIGATVAPSCSIQASNILFGNYDPTKGNTSPVPLNFNYTCTKNISLTLKFNGGNNSDSIDRYMSNTSGSSKLKYKLINSNGSTEIPINTNFLSEIANGSQTVKMISAYIPGNQSVSPGSYTDNLMLTLEY